MIGIILVNALIFFLLGAIHLYWAFGGKWGLNVAVPTKDTGGEKLVNPGIAATLVVAFGLFLAAVITVGNLEALPTNVPLSYIKLATIVITCIFILRAVGDFKYVGFTKKVKNTPFAKSDTLLFSPLCLYLGLTSLIIVM